MSLANAAWIWVPLLAIATIAAWSGMNDIASSRASIADQLLSYNACISGC